MNCAQGGAGSSMRKSTRVANPARPRCPGRPERRRSSRGIRVVFGVIAVPRCSPCSMTTLSPPKLVPGLQGGEPLRQRGSWRATQCPLPRRTTCWRTWPWTKPSRRAHPGCGISAAPRRISNVRGDRTSLQQPVKGRPGERRRDHRPSSRGSTVPAISADHGNRRPSPIRSVEVDSPRRA